MLARLQRAWAALLVALGILCVASMLSAGWPWWLALACGVAAINVHAVALAAEFALLSRVDPGPGIRRPTAGALVAAGGRDLDRFCGSLLAPTLPLEIAAKSAGTK
jgi:hypothetical protein